MVVKTTLNLIYKLVHKFPFSLDNKQYATQNSFFFYVRDITYFMVLNY